MEPPADARPRSSVLRRVLLVVGVLLTVGLFGLALLVTGFLACGVSGCTGGGFGPVYSPVEAQVGLLVAGLTLVPLAVWLVRRQAVWVRLVAGAGAVVLGAALAMVVLDLGPNGCPSGQSRATAGPEAIDPGSATCSRDRDALPPR